MELERWLGPEPGPSPAHRASHHPRCARGRRMAGNPSAPAGLLRPVWHLFFAGRHSQESPDCRRMLQPRQLPGPPCLLSHQSSPRGEQGAQGCCLA